MISVRLLAQGVVRPPLDRVRCRHVGYVKVAKRLTFARLDPIAGSRRGALRCKLLLKHRLCGREPQQQVGLDANASPHAGVGRRHEVLADAGPDLLTSGVYGTEVGLVGGFGPSRADDVARVVAA